MKVKLEKEPDNECDKIGDKTKGKVVFVVDGGVVCRITTTGIQNCLIHSIKN